MIDLYSAIKFCDSKNDHDYFNICSKPTGPFKVGDYALQKYDDNAGVLFRGFNNECRLTGKALKNFQCVYHDWYDPIEVLVPTNRLFGTGTRKQFITITKIQGPFLIRRFYECFVVLPLEFINSLVYDLLLPFSYLILQVLGKIEEFDKSYVDPTKENEYLEVLYSCAQTIDEIKTNCLNLYLNGVNLEDSMVKESNKRAQLMLESKQLKVITSSFFKDFNADFQPKLTEGDD